MNDHITTLDTLLPDLRVHVPDIAGTVGPLITELRLISDRGFTTGRSTFDKDAENLATNLKEICDLRRVGIVDQNVIDAEREMITLAVSLRSQAIAMIKDRTAMLKINAQVSAVRADPDMEPMDITDGYRLMAAMPADAHSEDGLIIQSLGLPEKGGQSGKIVGNMLLWSARDKGVYNDTAGPVDTFYLPAGRSVILHHGEQIRIHTHGGMTGTQNLDLNNFQNDPYHCEVEITSEHAFMHGPMTFEISKIAKLSEIKGLGQELSKINKPLSKMRRHLLRDDATENYMVTGIFALAACGFAAVVIRAITESDAVALSAFSPAVGCFLMPIVSLIYKKTSNRNFKAKLTDQLKQKISRACSVFGYSNAQKNVLEAENLTLHIQSAVKTCSACRFYPLRKLIVKEREGVRVIEPLKALAAPTPEITIPNVIQMKDRV